LKVDDIFLKKPRSAAKAITVPQREQPIESLRRSFEFGTAHLPNVADHPAFRIGRRSQVKANNARKWEHDGHCVP
jgi:hypothetical protein